VSRLWKGEQTRLVSGLPSIYNATTVDIAGPQDIDFQGRGNGYVTIGWGGPPAARSQLGALGPLFGTLIRVRPSGEWSVEAAISDFEAATNPDGGPVDSNPFGVLAEPGHQLVADAGGNSLVRVDADGSISLVAVFARVPAGAPTSEAVPTEVKRGPDGALYVSILSGVPFTAGNAGIYRVVPGEAPELYVGGFKTITDFDIAPDGTLWIVQYASSPTFFGGPGLLIRVDRDGTRTVVSADLVNPTGVLVGPDGAVYVSNRGNLADVGEVLRIVP
jgi:sugar lactone lactonase YvrE